MSLKLLLDKDSQAKYLVNLLEAAQHEILTINDADLTGQPDSAVLSYAKQQDYVLLTRNCSDFQELHLANPSHSGILAVYSRFARKYRRIANSVIMPKIVSQPSNGPVDQ